MSALVLDAEAVNLLINNRTGQATVRVWLEAARRQEREVTVPAAVLAELYRSAKHEAGVDSLLSRERGITITPTDRTMARTIGRLLAASGRDSRDHVDATTVAAALSKGGGVVITGDPDDLTEIAAGSTVRIVELD